MSPWNDIEENEANCVRTAQAKLLMLPDARSVTGPVRDGNGSNETPCYVTSENVYATDSLKSSVHNTRGLHSILRATAKEITIRLHFCLAGAVLK
jgi:hypothetical protein